MLLAICALDAAVGDPRAWPHPVGAIAGVTRSIELFLRARIVSDDARAELAAGAALTTIVTGAAILCALAAQRLGGAPAALVLGAAALAARSLDDTLAAVEYAAARGDRPLARTRLAGIVGRDTAELDDAGIARAALETAAESLCDGVIAPLLALRLGGIAGAWAYKAANTLDSLIGHIEPPYRYFGYASAKLDDALNFLPARITVGTIAAAALLMHEAPREAIAVAVRDGRLHRSPNAGWCEAALAGALRVRLGGDNHYDGVLVPGATFGGAFRAPILDDIRRGRRLARLAGLLAMGLAIVSSR